MADDEQEKSEEATQSRREDFRKKGQVVQSRELASALFLLFAAGGVFALGRFFFQEIYSLLQFSFGVDLVAAVRSGDIVTASRFAGLKFLYLVTPVLGISLLIGISSTVVQVGLLQVEDAISPNLDKINPIEGFKRMFSIRSLAEGAKAILKLLFILGIAYLVLKSEVRQVPLLVSYTIDQTLAFLGQVTIKLFGSIGLGMAALAGADYFYQRWELNKKMMMSKQEVKEEHKNREGDPLIKARIRRVQREVANRRMMEKVPKADVIITNPTHIAVALKYTEGLPAPQLIAKGADLIADKIKEIAKEHNIPIVENKPLARTIFKTLKLGQVIPRELFVAVAEVLAFVYRLRRKAKR